MENCNFFMVFAAKFMRYAQKLNQNGKKLKQVAKKKNSSKSWKTQESGNSSFNRLAEIGQKKACLYILLKYSPSADEESLQNLQIYLSGV